MRKLILFFYCSFLLADKILAQENLPTDFLSPAFHAGRRDSLRKMMPANSVMAVFAFPERTFSNDVQYQYHPNPDLYYFSGYKEPNAMLLIFKELRKYKDSITYNEVLFVQKDPQREQWTGRRLGVEGGRKLGFTLVFNGEDFGKVPVDFAGINKIIFDALPDSASSDLTAGDLSQLVSRFKKMIDLPADFDAATREDISYVQKRDNPARAERIKAYLKRNIANGKYKNPALINSYLQAKDSIEKKAIFAQVENEKWNNSLYSNYTNALRGIKTPEEMELLRKAVEISAIGHAEVMKAIRPDMSEREIEGIHDYVQKKYGAEHWGYPPIVGAGINGCVLHYEENEQMNIGNMKTLLMDVGAEYHGYSADVTRTVPANGKFTPDQKLIYNLVYDAQEAAFKLCKEGSSFAEIEDKAREILTNGMLKLGIIKKAEDYYKYYPHGCSHHIGLDVHDKGSYETLKQNMVITIEPGIYIPEGSDCDKKWWGIAVRIEDDLLIKEKTYELLSVYAPRKAEDVEKMVAEKSAFDDFKLPALKSAKKGF